MHDRSSLYGSGPLPRTRVTQIWRKTAQEKFHEVNPCQSAAGSEPLGNPGYSNSAVKGNTHACSAPENAKPGVLNHRATSMVGMDGAEEADTRSVCPTRSPTRSRACIFAKLGKTVP